MTRRFPQLKAILVVGAQQPLLEPRHAILLQQRGMLYAPDYAANAGGVINGCCREMLDERARKLWPRPMGSMTRC